MGPNQLESHTKPGKARRGKKQEAGRDVTSGENGPITMAVSGVMLVADSAAFHLGLVESFSRADWVEVDCRDLSDADLTFFQLLCAAHHFAMQKNKKLTISGQKTETFGTLARNMGLERHVGCVRDICHSCIWTGGGDL
jgi:ABC-type transporter Mla MlaB component